MPEYLHPGVYIEERPVPQSIEGVSTSTAGFVGATEKGPTSGLPVLVTSFADFTRIFGGFLPDDPWGSTRFLAYAVDGFFRNGGQRVYVKRVVGAGATASHLTLQDGFVTRLQQDTAGEQAKRRSVRLGSLLGIQKGTQLKFSQILAGNLVEEPATVDSYDAGTRTVTFAAGLANRFTAAGCTVTITGNPAPPGAPADRLRLQATSPGAWGDALRVTVVPLYGATALTQAVGTETALRAVDLAFAGGTPPGVGDTTVDLAAPSFALVETGDVVEFRKGTFSERRTITKKAGTEVEWAPGLPTEVSGADTTLHRITAIRKGAADPVVPVLDTAGFAVGNPLRLVQGGDRQRGKVKAIGAQTITLDTAAHPLTRNYLAGDRLALAVAGRSGADRLELSSTSNFYPKAVIELDTGTAKTYLKVKTVDGRALVLAANLNADVENDTAVRVVELRLAVDDGAATEVYDNLSLEKNTPRFVEDVVNTASRLVRAEVKPSANAAPFHLPRTLDGLPAPLRHGAAGAPPGPDDYIGVDNGPGRRSGIKALADIDQASLLAAPGISDPSVQGELIGQCELLKDRFAVLDPQPGSVIGGGGADDVIVQRSRFDTLYAALYYPWLKVRDPLYPQEREGRLIPPSGHVLGIFARVDVERGVHKAPANEVVRGILGLEVKVSEREQDILNPSPVNVNVIRDFRDNGRGIRVWGSRVMTSDNAWKYVPVRRLFIFIEESLDEGLQFVVFEPNGEDLWARVRRTIGGFLRRLWLDGAIAGVSEAEAFFVRCDRTTMTEDDLQNGRLIALVGVAPLRPAEFVIVRISQKTLEAAS